MKNEVMLLPLQGEENSLKSEKKVIQPLPVAQNEALQYLFSHHLFTFFCTNKLKILKIQTLI